MVLRRFDWEGAVVDKFSKCKPSTPDYHIKQYRKLSKYDLRSVKCKQVVYTYEIQNKRRQVYRKQHTLFFSLYSKIVIVLRVKEW